MATVAGRVVAPGRSLEDLEVTVERWLADAQDSCVPEMPSSDLDWLGGRVRALLDVLAFVRDGRDMAPPGSLPVARDR
jgi:hypothetical protein